MQKRHYIIFFLVLMMLFQMVNTDNITFAQSQIKLTAGLGTYPIRPGNRLILFIILPTLLTGLLVSIYIRNCTAVTIVLFRFQYNHFKF